MDDQEFYDWQNAATAMEAENEMGAINVSMFHLTSKQDKQKHWNRLQLRKRVNLRLHLGTETNEKIKATEERLKAEREARRQQKLLEEQEREIKAVIINTPEEKKIKVIKKNGTKQN